MKDLIRLLIQLQNLDSHILEKRAFIEKVPGRVHDVDEPLKLAKQDLEKMKQKTESLAKKKREKEQSLEEVNGKIAKMRARVSDIKTNKEYQAHLKEIEALEKEVSRVEEEILVGMEELDVGMKRQREKEQVLNEELAKMEVFKKQLDEEVREREKSLDSLKEDRSGVVSQLGPETYNLYRSLMQKGAGRAVTKAEDEICLGCNMNIPPQLFVEIRKNEEIIQCPQCRRILYYPEG